MKTTQGISVEQARRIALQAQRLVETDSRAKGKAAVAETIDHLGYVQIDTISVVERAHHHTLWTRCPEYDPLHLHDLQAIDKHVFEYWAHAVAYLPMTDYRYYIPRMERLREGGQAWFERWVAEHGNLCDNVLDRIRVEGALSSKDFDSPPGAKRGTWWDWKPAKRALEILFRQGHLMIGERRNFQKMYDLTERVLPRTVKTTRPTNEELARFHIRRALGGLGIARIREIRDAFHIVDQASIAATLNELLSEGELHAVRVGDLPDTYYSAPSVLESGNRPIPDRARILSPFDGLVIQRERIKRLFGFEYTIECYVPAAKRTYGYFVLPVLWKDRLIARLDPKADRKRGILFVKGLWFEPGFEAFEAALPDLAEVLARYARFNGCENVEFAKIDPAGHKRRLKSLVRRAFIASDR